jgi:hypothetical protein
MTMLTINLKESKCLEYGINVHKLKPGTTVYAATKNSVYKIVKCDTDQYRVWIQGGKYFPQPAEANFSGSTFGGSIMKIGWIGYGMYMEIYSLSHRKKYKTTPVEAARVVGNGWEYDMDWDKQGISTEPKIT